MTRALIIDTDGGVDDCAAIWWALTDPGTDVVAITTTHGSVAQPAATASVLSLLAAAGRLDVPVAAGGPERFGPVPGVEPAAFIHGLDGQGDTNRPAPDAAAARLLAEPAEDLLRRVVDERPGEVSVLALAPLTNLARAVAADPTWAGRVHDLAVMGGSIQLGGNAFPAGEANIAGDPEGAAAVVCAGWSRPPLLVPLDVTHWATLTDAEFALLAERRNPAADFLDAPLRFYRTFGSTFTGEECPCHDLLAALAWADPELLTAPVLPLAVQSQPGPAWGMTVADQRAPFFARLPGSEQSAPPGFSPWRVALDADVDSFRAKVTALFGG